MSKFTLVSRSLFLALTLVACAGPDESEPTGEITQSVREGRIVKPELSGPAAYIVKQAIHALAAGEPVEARVKLQQLLEVTGNAD